MQHSQGKRVIGWEPAQTVCMDECNKSHDAQDEMRR
jgi:hypothetical protein